MSNIITTLVGRIEDYRASNKNPCKNYATEDGAEKAVAAIALKAAQHFTKQGFEVTSARYIVIYCAAWGRWVGCVDMTELLARPSSTGGYIGICTGFFTF